MQVIGDRSSILKKDGLFSLVILSTNEKKKVGLMFLWLLAWTVSGFIIIVNYFKVQNINMKLGLIIWIGFWAYFEFKIFNAFRWKKFGKEKLWVKDGKLHYQREVQGRGKIRSYDLNLVSEVRFLEIEKGNFADVFNQSFWVKGGERLEIACQAKVIRFGMQLSDSEAKAILKEINQFLRTAQS